MDKITIPDPAMTSRIRTAEVRDASEWVSPYTPAQALAIVLYNNHALGTLQDAFRVAESAMRSLKPMGFTVEFTGV